MFDCQRPRHLVRIDLRTYQLVTRLIALVPDENNNREATNGELLGCSSESTVTAWWR